MFKIKITPRLIAQNLFDVALLFYFCVLSGNKTGVGLDAMLVRVSLVVVVTLGVFYLLTSFRKHCPNQRHLLWMFSFWGYALFSILWASSTSDSLMYANYYISILLVGTLMCYRIRSISDVNRMLKMFLIAGIYTVIVIIIRVPAVAYGTSKFGDYIGVFKNTLSARMVILVLLALYFGKSKKIYYVSIPAFLFVIANADSRKGIALLIGAVLLSILITGKTSKSLRNILIGLCVVVLVWVVMDSFGLLNILAGGVFENIYNLISQGFGDSLADSYRIVLISAGLTMFSQKPLFGYGLNNFRTYIGAHGYPYVVYSHNTYIELLSTLGLVGFLLYYPYLFSLMRKTFQMRSNALMRTTFLVLVVALINDLGAVTYFDVYSQHLYIVLAAAVIVSYIDKPKMCQPN